MNLSDFLTRWFDVRPGEGRLVLSSFLGAYCVISFLILAKSLREALYLSVFDVTTLPYVIIGAAVLSLPTAGLFGRWMSSGNPRRVYVAYSRRLRGRPHAAASSERCGADGDQRYLLPGHTSGRVVAHHRVLDGDVGAVLDSPGQTRIRARRCRWHARGDDHRRVACRSAAHRSLRCGRAGFRARSASRSDASVAVHHAEA